MKSATALVLTAATTFVLAACGVTSTPTGPSASASFISGNTAWSCFAEHACPAMSRSVAGDGALVAPGAPLNLMAAITGSTVALNWAAPAPSDPVSSYVVEAGGSAGSSNIAAFDTFSAATSLTVTGVPSGTYFIRVRGRNSAGTSAASNEVIAAVGGGTCASAPNPPSGLIASVSGASLSLSWTAPTAGCTPTGYVIEAGSTPGSSNIASFNTGSVATTFAASGVPSGTFYLRVRASNGLSAGAPSNEVTVVIGGAPPPPPPSPLTGRWVGTAPDGMIAELNEFRWCPYEYDLELNLTANGSVVTGTATTRLRRVSSNRCGDVFGEVAQWSVTSGQAGSGTLTFSLGDNRLIDFSGTFTATRMTGTFLNNNTSQPGSFAVTRQ